MGAVCRQRVRKTYIRDIGQIPKNIWVIDGHRPRVVDFPGVPVYLGIVVPLFLPPRAAIVSVDLPLCQFVVDPAPPCLVVAPVDAPRIVLDLVEGSP